MLRSRLFPVFVLLLLSACGRTHVVPPLSPPSDAAMDADVADATDDADEPDAEAPQPRLARNIIVFMGDGMGPEQLATGRFTAGGRLQHIDRLAGPALANTDSLTSQDFITANPGAAADRIPPTDSAASATAIATGVLVDNGAISEGRSGEPLESVLEACKRAGKATGIVTTSYFFDASPAAFTAHQPTRGNYVAIAHQILAVTKPDVVMGNHLGLIDDPPTHLREDADASGYHIVRNVTELMAWDPTQSPRLLGLFMTDFRRRMGGGEAFTMTPALERTATSADPTLAQMTQRAIDRLSTDPDGFFLFAEDEIFDQIGHGGLGDVEWANRAYPQQVAALDEAVGVAIDWVLAHSSFDETLIVVLADHETGGYHFDHAIGPSSGTFAHGGHTRTPIEVYALGAGAGAVISITGHRDTHSMLIGTLR